MRWWRDRRKFRQNYFMKTYLAVHRGTSHHIDYSLSLLYHFTHSIVVFRAFPQKPFGTQHKNFPQTENIKQMGCLQQQNHLWYLDITGVGSDLVIATPSHRYTKSSLRSLEGPFWTKSPPSAPAWSPQSRELKLSREGCRPSPDSPQACALLLAYLLV